MPVSSTNFSRLVLKQHELCIFCQFAQHPRLKHVHLCRKCSSLVLQLDPTWCHSNPLHSASLSLSTSLLCSIQPLTFCSMLSAVSLCVWLYSEADFSWRYDYHLLQTQIHRLLLVLLSKKRYKSILFTFSSICSHVLHVWLLMFCFSHSIGQCGVALSSVHDVLPVWCYLMTVEWFWIHGQG